MKLKNEKQKFETFSNNKMPVRSTVNIKVTLFTFSTLTDNQDMKEHLKITSSGHGEDFRVGSNLTIFSRRTRRFIR